MPFVLMTAAASAAKGVQFVGLLPAEFQNWFVNTAGVRVLADIAKSWRKIHQ